MGPARPVRICRPERPRRLCLGLLGSSTAANATGCGSAPAARVPSWAAPDYVELNAAYSYHLGGAWDVNAGVRHDLQTGPDRSYLQLGGQYDDGSALWFGGWAYLSHKGELSARLAGYYNQKLAGGLIVQPSAELDYYGEDIPELGLGRGFGYAEAGLRLRYEVKEAFAPYLGLSWSRDLGRTARMTRAEGEAPETKSVVMGVRSSF